MTMSELHSLYERYFPAAPPQLQAMGQGSVTARTVTSQAPGVWHQQPCGCGCGRLVTGRRLYINDAHKQKAYRQRKRAVRQAAA